MAEAKKKTTRQKVMAMDDGELAELAAKHGISTMVPGGLQKMREDIVTEVVARVSAAERAKKRKATKK